MLTDPPSQILDRQFELEGLRRHTSELQTENLESNRKIAQLEAEIQRLGGTTPDYRESIQRQVAHSKDELLRVDSLFRASVKGLNLITADVAKTKVILDDLKHNVTELMVTAIDKSARRRQPLSIAVSFILGVATSLVAAWLWSLRGP